jgi:cytochrome P450
VESYPKTRLTDLARLIRILVRTRARKGDAGEALVAWLRGLGERYRSPNFFIDLIVRRVLFVSDPNLSAHVLAKPPSTDAFVAGTTKRKAMSFLAPHALTILQGDEWRAYRAYNEEVLQTARPHSYRPAILAQVEKAFGQPTNGIDDIRRRMGQVMLGAVFGEGNAPEHLVDEIQELFAEVGIRTALFGSRKTALRSRFRDELRRLWQSGAGATQPTLLALAHSAVEKIETPFRREEIVIDQIPHWMFTFTNSGSDLLARSLAMIRARPDSFLKVRREIESVGNLSKPESIDALQYLEACIMEAGRLYPPVVQTAHRAAQTDSFEGRPIPAGTEIVQYFPLGNRDRALDQFADHFRPERWLNPEDPVHKHAPNLFLSGARACPGRTLILFIEKAAIAMQLRRESIQAKHSILTDDPLPFSFPRRCLQP